jgi:hypothetical protein
MAGEVASIAVEMTPYVSAVLGAYGGRCKALEADTAMLAQVRTMLASAPRTAVTQNILKGRDTCVAGRDQTVVNYRRLGA